MNSAGCRFLQRYVVYAYVILALTISSALFNAFESWRNLHAIQKLASSECTVMRVTAHTGGADDSLTLRSERVKSSQLMPGDLIEVLPGMIFPCDCVLLTGQAVINEVRRSKRHCHEHFAVPRWLRGPQARMRQFEIPSENGSKQTHRLTVIPIQRLARPQDK